ncbi:hypothetical protein KAURM247S_08137 [Kitasatospora aureofaciens]
MSSSFGRAPTMVLTALPPAKTDLNGGHAEKTSKLPDYNGLLS